MYYAAAGKGSIEMHDAWDTSQPDVWDGLTAASSIILGQ